MLCMSNNLIWDCYVSTEGKQAHTKRFDISLPSLKDNCWMANAR